MSAKLRRVAHDAPVDAVHGITDEDGAVIVEGLAAPELIEALNRDLDPFVAEYSGQSSGSDLYDLFLGKQTNRLHGLCAKSHRFAEVLVDARALAFCDHELLGSCSSYQLSTAEFIEVGEGQDNQILHRDEDIWVDVPRPRPPLMATVMLALTDFTVQTGATRAVPGSHRWPLDRVPKEGEIANAEMSAGSALFFRGDLLHGAGTNTAAGVRRRGVAIEYCCGWLRPVENSFLTVPLEVARGLPRRAQELLGYAAHDATARAGGVVGLYENGDPMKLLAS